MDYKIIAIDDEPVFLTSIKRLLITSGYKDITTADTYEKAKTLFTEKNGFDIAFLDLSMPEVTGLELLTRIKKFYPETECIMLTAVDDARAAVSCMNAGAFDYLLKPVQKDELLISIRRALERKRFRNILTIGKDGKLPELYDKEAFKSIITESPNMIRMLKEAELYAAGNVPVIITGESGTGKELLAKAIHLSSPRKNATFTPVNMAAITGSLFDSEFFGHTKGAFTGAEKARKGYFENSDEGTIFLDEIGILPFELQGKLLRVLQGGEFMRPGSDSLIKTDVRIISATNEDLSKLVSQKKFRNDLFYRLRGGWLHIPPLRERKQDIPLLIDKFIQEPEIKGKVRFEDRTMDLLLEYQYPGNVRELESIVKSAVNLSRKGIITEMHLPVEIRKIKAKGKQFQDTSKPLPLADIEKKHILYVYELTGNNKSQSAKLLGIGLNTLRRKLESYGVS